MNAVQDNAFQELRGEIRAVAKDVEEIKMAVSGDTHLGIDGIVKRVSRNEAEIQSFKKWRNQIHLKVAYTTGIVTGLTFLGGEGVKALIELFTHKP